MFLSRVLHAPECASCRLRASIVAKQLARSRKVIVRSNQRWQGFHVGRTVWKYGSINPKEAEGDDVNLVYTRDGGRRDIGERGTESNERQTLLEEQQKDIDSLLEDAIRTRQALDPAEAALHAREGFGDVLPEGELTEEALRVYERLYGAPKREEEENTVDESDVEESAGTGILEEAEDGVLGEVEFDEDEAILEEEVDEDVEVGSTAADARLALEIEASLSAKHEEQDTNVEEDAEESEADPFPRTHPLTLANRFTTSPSTLPLPAATLVDPISKHLSSISNTHLKDAAHRVFGGIGLPYSASTPSRAKTMQAKPIAVDVQQSSMSEIEGDVFMAAVMPGVYATVMSTLVETRKRQGTAWAEDLVRKAQKSNLKVLDAGGGGAGILALREMLRAEWQRMHEDSTDVDSGMALAEADGKTGGAGVDPPLGQATVLTGSDTLRKKASSLLANTTFIPRLPDYMHTEDAKQKGRFDIIIAPHTMWPLRLDHLRKTHLLNLWSLLSTDGGVLILLEKGVPRGFELIASAREQLLESRIASPPPISKPPPVLELDSSHNKEQGMIIAPCTNHEVECPMHHPKGLVKGRRDICHFEQRYVRPAFLQNILGARDKNYEDVKFSYLSVMRGRDLRQEDEERLQRGTEATERAFTGHEDLSPDDLNGLQLPRAILPPLKRRGHVILDLCTPAGTLERWTVPRSFSKQAFRDARKSGWGDLWALGAKTRVPRNPKVKKRNNDADLTVNAKTKKGAPPKKDAAYGYDEYGRIVIDGEASMPADKGRTVKYVDGQRKRSRKEKPRGRKRSSEVEQA